MPEARVLHELVARGYSVDVHFVDSDAFVRDSGGEQPCWVNTSDATRQTLDLRHDAAIDHPALTWAEDVELGDGLPR